MEIVNYIFTHPVFIIIFCSCIIFFDNKIINKCENFKARKENRISRGY